MHITVFMCLSVFSCTTKKEVESDERVSYLVTAPIVIDTVFAKEYIAEIQSIQNVEIRPRLKGVIEKILVDEGQEVLAGQLIMSLNKQELQVALLKANAQLKSAIAEKKSIQIEVENTRKLVDNNVISSSELVIVESKLDAIKAKIDEVKADISGVELQVGFTQIRAPFTGIINRIPFKVGATVDEGTVLTKLSNNKEVFAYFNLSELEHLALTSAKDNIKGKKVKLLLANDEPYGPMGSIETTETEFDQHTGNIAIRAKFINSSQLLKHGSSGKVVIEQNLQQAMIIPQKSTFEVQDKTFVYVVTAKGKVQSMPVKPILRLNHLYVVAGLSLQDQIVYEGIQNVKEGDIISVKFTSMKAILAGLK